MPAPSLKFSGNNKPEFNMELRRRVNLYFTENQISKYANNEMKAKTAIMLILYFTPLILMLSGLITGVWPIMGLWAIMGFGMSGIGLSIMHDANHGSYSKDKRVNNFFGFMLNFIGGYHTNWKIQHNVLHHSYTNIDGYDEDIDKPLMRFSPHQEWKPLHRFQKFYAPFLYGFMTIFWLLVKDYKQVIRYDKMDLLAGQGLNLWSASFYVFIHKLWYLTIFLALPIMVLNLPWWQTVLGFFLMHFISGLILAFVFQPAHVVEEADFVSVEKGGTVENSWAEHQLQTTSNCAPDSRLFSWYVGGLNYQIEHHLFANICHVHYKNISPIVKQTALEYGLPYNQHQTFYDALKSHFGLLSDLGAGK